MKSILCITVFLFSITSGDDCGIGTDAGNVFIEYVKNIEMAKERVDVEMGRDSAVVKCKFWFFNRGDKMERDVGFPNFWVSPPEASEEIMDFKTWVDGKEIKVHMKEQATLDIDGKDTLPDMVKNWFVWSTVFKAKDTTIIENRYTSKYTSCDGTREKSVYYVLGTGRTWEGKIGQGTIVFDFKNLLSTAWVKPSSRTNKAIKTVIRDNRIEFSFNNFEPKENDGFVLDFYPPWDTVCCGGDDQKFNEFTSTKKRRDLRLMRNEIYARHGYVFSDPDLVAFFSAEPWYHPDPGFKPAMLSEGESKTVQVLNLLEHRK